jgi:hypothetical protein
LGKGADSWTLAIGHLRADGKILIDNVLEIRPPFDPEDAVDQCVTLMKRYGVSVTLGDKVGGEWVIGSFGRRGSQYDDSAPRKSDIYIDFAPIVISGRIELLDLPRLVQQLTGLERRLGVFGGGKDRVDHIRDGHDDVANAVAGVAALLDQDRRPALIDLKSLTSDEGAGEVVSFGSVYPGRLDVFFLTVADAGPDLAWVLCGHGVDYSDKPSAHEKLYVLDADVGYYRPGFFDTLMDRIREIASELGPRDFSIIGPEHMAAQLRRYGPVLSPTSAFDPDLWVSAAADHIDRRRVRFCQKVTSQMRTNQAIATALSLRAGDPIETALRKALIWSVWAHVTPYDAAMCKTFR